MASKLLYLAAVTLLLKMSGCLDTGHSTRDSSWVINFMASEGGVAAPKEFPCPASQDILPCVCTMDEDGELSLVCHEVASTDDLASIFQTNFPVLEYSIFRLQDSSNITHLTNILNGLTFKTVYLSSNENLELISEDFLVDSMNTLEILYIQNSSLYKASFPFLTLGLYTNLGRLDLRNAMELTSIPKLSSNSLKYVNFAGCVIDSFEAGTFNNVLNAQEIHLENNELTRLEASSFQLTNLLFTLQLRENRISYIDPQAFLPPATPEPNEVRLLIDLSGNVIAALAPGTFQFTQRHHILNLDRNLISDILQGTFVLPSDTELFSLELRLSQNLITELPQEVYGELFPYLTSLELYDNPLDCGCDVAWIVLNSTNLEKIGNSTTCHDGTNMHDLNPDYYEHFC